MRILLTKDESYFIQDFLEKEFGRDVPFTFLFPGKELEKYGMYITLNAMWNNSNLLSSKKDGEWIVEPLSKTRTFVGFKRKLQELSVDKNINKFVIPNSVVKKLENVVVLCPGSMPYFSQNQEMFLRFIDSACEKTKESGYKNNYINLCHHILGGNLLKYLEDNDGMYKKIDAVLAKHNIPNISFFRYTEEPIEHNYINNNLGYLIVSTLRNYYALDDANSELMYDEGWRKFYFQPIMSALQHHSVEFLREYNKNPSVKKELDFLVQNFESDISEDLLDALKRKRIGVEVKIEDDIFFDNFTKNENTYKNNFFIKLDLNTISKQYPAQLTVRADFNQTVGKIISQVLVNLNQETSVDSFLAGNNVLLDIKTNMNNSEPMLKNMIVKVCENLNILTVESSDYAIVNKISILINNDLMMEQNEIKTNKKELIRKF